MGILFPNPTVSISECLCLVVILRLSGSSTQGSGLVHTGLAVPRVSPDSMLGVVHAQSVLCPQRPEGSVIVPHPPPLPPCPRKHVPWAILDGAHTGDVQG